MQEKFFKRKSGCHREVVSNNTQQEAMLLKVTSLEWDKRRKKEAQGKLEEKEKQNR